ncbi:MAG: ABC transporter permease [Acidobacteria bacterium]|nr:ABC transporter permease [Acidobacteriota bacterium]
MSHLRRATADVLLGLALLAYPKAFRARFGPEIRADFRVIAATGPWPVLVHTLGQHVVCGAAERVAALRRWPLWPNRQSHLYEPRGSRAVFWENLRSDIGHALVLARRRPVVTALAVLALALGIGANSAIFTVVNGVLLQPLPYGAPDDLAMVWSSNPREQKPTNVVSPANFLDYREGVKDLADLEGFMSFVSSEQMTTSEGLEPVLVVNVGLRMFDVLQRQPIIGRTFAPGDTDAVVLSHGYWQRRFGGDPTTVGRVLTLEGRPSTVVGIMPDDFVFPYSTMLGPDGFTTQTGVDAWSAWSPERDPFASRDGRIVRNVHYLAVVARLHAGVDIQQLESRLAVVARQLEQAYPDSNAGWGTAVVPLHEQAVGPVRTALLLLLGGVGIVLLMACVNVAGLALAQSVARSRELAVRAALGAGRGRLVRQFLTEAVLLAMAGAAMALVAVNWGVRGLVALAPRTIPRLGEITPDGTVLGVTLAVAVLAGIGIGLVPAFAASRPDLRDALQDGGRGAAGASPKARRLRSALVVSEVALAVLLSTGAVLLLRSFTSLLSVNPGFSSASLLTMQITLPRRLATADARLAYYDELFARLRAVPGVVAAGGTTRLPLGSTSVSTTLDVEGRVLADADLPEVQFRRAVDDFFGAMQMPILRGRGFTREDGPQAPPAAVINEALAARLFPGEDPIGRRIRTGPNPARNPWMTVVGVVGSVRHAGLEQAPAAELYIPHRQGPPVAPFIVLRTSGDPAGIVESVRSGLRDFDRGLALFDVRTMTDVRATSVAPRRFILVLVSSFGLLALLLAAVGVYGVMALVVGERTREVGVRLALGAQPGAVLRMVLGQATRLALAGIVAGLVGAGLLSPLLEHQLFGIRPYDPVTFAAVPAVLLLVAAAAAYAPARRAMRIDPTQAIREQ